MNALHWIVSFLDEQQIPYLVCGGLAANAYGVDRPLNDIDIYVPHAHFDRAVAFGRDYITRGPLHHVSATWDLIYVEFTYQGQYVEIASDQDVKIYDAARGEWVKQELDFEQFEEIDILGVTARVMTKSELISYKSILRREVDLMDIAQLQGA